MNDEHESPSDGGPHEHTTHEAHDHAEHDLHEHAAEHDHHHHDVDEVGVALVTVSTSREAGDDPSGDYLESAFEEAGHDVVTREIIPDDFDRVQETIDQLVNRDDTSVVVTSGGTGVTPDDVTPEAARPLFDKRLPGFGELFRRLSFEEIGTRTIGSRSIGGVADETLVFCMPGSENAVSLGVDEVVLPEIGHLVGLASRD